MNNKVALIVCTGIIPGIVVCGVITLSVAYEYDVTEIRKQSIPDMHQQATEMMKAEQYDEAIDIFSKIIDIDKSDLTAWHWKGVVLFYEVKQCSKFFEHSVQYLKQFPDNMWAESTFGVAKKCEIFEPPYPSLKSYFAKQQELKDRINQ